LSTWRKLGSVSPRDLTEARLQLHWAAQLAAAVGASLVLAKPDDSHTALTHIPERSVLVTHETETEPPRRVALSLPDLRLILVTEELKELDELPLDGKTIETGLDWLRAKLSRREIALPSYDMPPHAVGNGEAFRTESVRVDENDPFSELTSWFNNASHVLRQLNLGEVRCWPHHFDVASLITLDGDKTIGVGWSPGDSSYGEPYWYVTPWPYPESADRPELPTGHWHSEDFVAAILTGTAMTSEASGQQSSVTAFLDAAIAGSRKLLG
jgi:hypothetical protein